MSGRDSFGKGIEFDPYGNIIQVEHAKEAVKRGAPVAGIIFDGGVALIALKKTNRKLVLRDSMEKMFQIDDFIVMSASGLIPDARKLAEQARSDAAIYQKTFDESISTEKLARELGDIMQSHTQYAGVRIFGTSLLVAGMEDGRPRLFEIDPSGSVLEYSATSIGGAENEKRIKILEDRWDGKLTEEDAIILGIDVLLGTQKESPADASVEGCVITSMGLKKIPSDEMEEYMKKAAEKIMEEVGEK